MTNQRMSRHLGSYDHEYQVELPKREILRFDGNPKSYCAFIKQFHSMVEKKTKNNETCLTYLIQYYEGEAKKAIQHCMILEPDDELMRAKEILKKRFGQSYVIARAFIDGLIDGPPIRSDDTRALTTLSQQMQACVATLRQLGYPSVLNSSRTMEAIVMRLPSQLRFKWAEVATTLMRHGKEPQLDELASFIEERVDIVSSRFGELAVTLKGDHSIRHVLTSRGTQFGVRRNIHTATIMEMKSNDKSTTNRCTI
ncbi:unnamed protein product [Echinostoma caproni]|uniref:Integrase catalytic domain-containing protein n=1 Tax=Echinostoma caproni TaxID=27848 RepID=A0A183AZ34_9TREM|nr:unnamed protein product [Echinostoma caproni]